MMECKIAWRILGRRPILPHLPFAPLMDAFVVVCGWMAVIAVACARSASRVPPAAIGFAHATKVRNRPALAATSRGGG
jgi:hypothetical protein